MRTRRLRRPAALVVALGLLAGASAGAAAAPGPGPEAGTAPAVAAPVAALPTAPMSEDLTRLYIDAVYYDLFDRDVDPAGLETWTGLLMSGTPRRAVADAITGSEEYRAGLIRYAYETYLGRGPDPSGLAHWLRMMRQGMTIQQLEAGFLGSTEFFNAHASGSNETFIRALYGVVLGRVPDSWEVHSWEWLMHDQWIPTNYPPYSVFHRASSREATAYAFLMSTERLAADIDSEYQWLLGRGLDPSGKQTWVTAIQRGTRYEAVVGSIIASEEYLAYIQTWMR